ncbi:MAG: hypothetical protein C4298_06205 [Thermus sp.]
MSVTTFPLVKPFRPRLWPQVARELDRLADRLSRQLGGMVEASGTVRIAGLPGRRYDISYSRGDARLRQRIVFLLRRRTEYQLLCRWRPSPLPAGSS